MTSRSVRRLTAVLTTGVALAAAPAAFAEEYLLQIGTGRFIPGNTAVQVSAPGGTPPGTPGNTLDAPARMRISRAGLVLDDRTADVQAGWFIHLSSDVVLARGDRVEIFYPASAELPSRDLTWDGRPTLDSCAIGSTTVEGTQNVNALTVRGAAAPGTFIQYALVERPPGPADVAAITQAGEVWTGVFGRPLLAGDVVDFVAHSKVDPAFGITHHVQAAAGSCATDPPEVPVYDLPDGVLHRLQKRDVEQRDLTVRVRVRCEQESRIACRGRAVLARAGKTVRARKLSVAPGKSSLVKLKLTRRVARQLERRKRLKARVLATTSDAAGKRLVTSRALTLKRRR